MGQRGLHSHAAVLWHWVLAVANACCRLNLRWVGAERRCWLLCFGTGFGRDANACCRLNVSWVGAERRCWLLCFGTGLWGTQVLVAMFGRHALAVLLEQPVAERMTQNASLN